MDLPIGEPSLRSAPNPLLQLAEALHASADLVVPLCALRNQARHRFVVS